MFTYKEYVIVNEVVNGSQLIVNTVIKPIHLNW